MCWGDDGAAAGRLPRQSPRRVMCRLHTCRLTSLLLWFCIRQTIVVMFSQSVKICLNVSYFHLVNKDQVQSVQATTKTIQNTVAVGNGGHRQQFSSRK